MKKYFLVGTFYEKEDTEEELKEIRKKSKCVDLLNYEDNISAFDGLEEYILKNRMKELDDFDILFLISEDLKVVARVSSFKSIDLMQMDIKNNGDLKEYSPVYVDIAEHDERVLISDVLDVDMVDNNPFK